VIDALVFVAFVLTLGALLGCLHPPASPAPPLPEETRKIGLGNFLRYVFPLIRTANPRLVAEHLVSAQPMTRPLGPEFYRVYELARWRHKTDKLRAELRKRAQT
jgi:hypothetical protein